MILNEYSRVLIGGYITINTLLVLQIIGKYLMIKKEYREPFIEYCIGRINLPQGDTQFIGLMVINGMAVFVFLSFWVGSLL